MPELQGAIGELSFTVQVTRKDTGKTEEVRMAGFINDEELKSLQAEGLIPLQTKEQ